MPSQTTLIVFPHQLFMPHPGLIPNRPVVLVEPWLFFRQYAFHKLKLAYHRATMRSYQQRLEAMGFTVQVVESRQQDSGLQDLLALLTQQGFTRVCCCHVADDYLRQQITAITAQGNLGLEWLDSPAFLNHPQENQDMLGSRRPFFQTDFYTKQRKRLGILLDQNGKPEGGQWTYDGENREKYPKDKRPPAWPARPLGELERDALAFANTQYAENPGEAVAIPYPIDHAGAEAWLQIFLQERFKDFGPYEDAMVAGEHLLHHSVLTPMLNIGLITPKRVVEAALNHAAGQAIPLNSSEGFIRQIIGWREFIKAVYDSAGRKQRTRNYWAFTRKIPAAFYHGTTGIAPIDDVIGKLLKTGYNHHIERLMVLGNFFLLCEFDPDEVYRWFMEMYIDAYDWVMVPNVYGMTQFADGGLMTTKPYISGSNYLIKMSNYPKGTWQTIWDGLFWRFMHVHRSFFIQNPRLGMLVKTFDKMPVEKQQAHLHAAETFLTKLDAQP